MEPALSSWALQHLVNIRLFLLQHIFRIDLLASVLLFFLKKTGRKAALSIPLDLARRTEYLYGHKDHKRGSIMPTVSVAAAKSRLSELIAKSSYAREHFVITRRNKPVAALVGLEDLKIIEQNEERQGLASIAGQWKGFEEVENQINNLASLRKDSGSRRNVSL